jgi:cobalt-zinc-cadmium efflux system membrane fusion protein
MRLAAIAALALAAAACGGEEPTAPAAGQRKAADGAMCAEHGVLEALCTRCNPKLIPVFQAKGDWCAEHGFPESICPICHPERGGRPAADVSSSDDAPPDGTLVRFARKDIARVAGIQTRPARPREGGARLEVLVTLAYDARRMAQVNARAPGVVRSLAVEIGERVARGASLATIESGDVGAERSRLSAARARVRLAESTLARDRRLAAEGITPAKDVLTAEAELETARADEAAARAALGMVGGGQASTGSYRVTAPLAGLVVRRGATVGHMVDADDALFEIVDPSILWAELAIPEPDLGAIAPGQKVSIALDAHQGPPVSGALEYVAPEIDPATRTALARVSIANPDGRLRANMVGTATIELGASRATLLVPRAAVQRAGGASFVFVRKAEDVFELRRVRLGSSEADTVEVISGLEAGAVVATEGSFLLKTETLKGAIGAGCCDPE